MTAYYNENDTYCAQWLRNLIAAGHIAPGEVDERSIADVLPADLREFEQCHFFAGIGVWSYALHRAGWPDDRSVWTGSCPCQPFSAAGKGDEFADERHLWPAWFRLIRECRPVIVFGEQVASKNALAWLDFVCADLEAAGYAVGALDTCAAGFGAPHIRQRIYFVANAAESRSERARQYDGGSPLLRARSAERSNALSVADAEHAERRALDGSEQDERDGNDARRPQAHGVAGACSTIRELGDAEQPRLQKQRGERRIPSNADGTGARETVERAGASVRALNILKGVG